MMAGASRSPAIEPTFSPLKMKDIERDLSDFGALLEIMSIAAEGAIPSPKPTKARDRHKPGMVPARNGTKAVARDHNATPSGIISLPPNL